MFSRPNKHVFSSILWVGDSGTRWCDNVVGLNKYHRNCIVKKYQIILYHIVSYGIDNFNENIVLLNNMFYHDFFIQK